MFGVTLYHSLQRFNANLAVIFGSYKLKLHSRRGFTGFPLLQQTHTKYPSLHNFGPMFLTAAYLKMNTPYMSHSIYTKLKTFGCLYFP